MKAGQKEAVEAVDKAVENLNVALSTAYFSGVVVMLETGADYVMSNRDYPLLKVGASVAPWGGETRTRLGKQGRAGRRGSSSFPALGSPIGVAVVG